jgi:hypothetical protein
MDNRVASSARSVYMAGILVYRDISVDLSDEQLGSALQRGLKRPAPCRHGSNYMSCRGRYGNMNGPSNLPGPFFPSRSARLA